MKLLTLIVTYNGERWIRACLGSLRDSSMPTEVLVVDNASSDPTVDLIAAEFPEVRLQRSAANLGFGKANNLGLQQAWEQEYDYVFLLNQDAWIDQDCLGKLVAAHAKAPQAGILSPLHLRGDGQALDSRFLRYYLPEATTFLNHLALGQPLVESYPCLFVNAAFWLLPRKTLATVGGFDPLFPHYGEDVDYVNRVLFHALEIHLVPAARACHDREQAINFQADHHSDRGRFNRLLINLLNPQEQLEVTTRRLAGLLLRGTFHELSKPAGRTGLASRCLAWWRAWRQVFACRATISQHRALNARPAATFLDNTQSI